MYDGQRGRPEVAPLGVDDHLRPRHIALSVHRQRADVRHMLGVAGVGARAQNDAYFGGVILIAAAGQRAHRVIQQRHHLELQHIPHILTHCQCPNLSIHLVCSQCILSGLLHTPGMGWELAGYIKCQ